MLKDPFPSPERKSTGEHRIGGAYFSQLKVKDPRARIFVMGALLILLLFASFMLNHYASSDPGPEVGEEPPSIEIGSAMPQRFSGVPALNATLAERITDTGPDASARWPSDAAGYLLYEVAHTPSVRAYGRNLLPLVPGSAAEIRKDSRPWRFKYVVFRGKLEMVEEQNYEATYGKFKGGEIGVVQRARVVVEGGDAMDPPLRVTFVTMGPMIWRDRNEINPTARPIVDGWVRVRGIFVKNFVDKDGEGGPYESMLVMATQVDRDYERVEVKSLADIPFQIIDDDPSIADTREGQEILAKNYPKTMYRLIKYAEQRAGEYGKELREKEALEKQEIDKHNMYETVIGQPARYRAEYFGGMGIIAKQGYRFDASSIEPNDANVEECFDGWIATDHNRLIQFVAPGPLMQRDWPKNTRIRWAGYFYKAKGYPAFNHTRRLAPFIVLTQLEEVKLPPPNYQAQFIFAGAFLVGLILLVWIIIRNDRASEEYRRGQRGRKIKSA